MKSSFGAISLAALSVTGFATMFAFGGTAEAGTSELPAWADAKIDEAVARQTRKRNCVKHGNENTSNTGISH